MDPVIIEDNYFESNVGLFGGAISVVQPDFSVDSSDGASDSDFNRRRDPVILINSNTFYRSQSYLSGNAIHASFTRPRYPERELAVTALEACT